jgi:hypothetical protein
MLGLFTKEEVLSVKRAGFKNPRKLATRIAEEVILTANEIWTSRNIFNKLNKPSKQCHTAQ